MLKMRDVEHLDKLYFSIGFANQQIYVASDEEPDPWEKYGGQGAWCRFFFFLVWRLGKLEQSMALLSHYSALSSWKGAE